MAQVIGYPQGNALFSGTNESAAPLPVGFNRLPEFDTVGKDSVPVMAAMGPGGGNRNRGAVVRAGDSVSGLPAGRLQELLSWVKPVHLPILNPVDFAGMAAMVASELTMTHEPGSGEYSNAALRVTASGATAGARSFNLPLPIPAETAVAAQPVRAAGAVHLRLKCSDWSKVTQLYFTLCQNGGFTDRRMWYVVRTDGRAQSGCRDPNYAAAWNGKWRTFVAPSAEFIASGTPADWGAGARYMDVTGVQMTIKTSAAVTIDIDRAYSPDWPVGIITPIFDGWYSSSREFAAREFLPRGWGAGGSANLLSASGIYPTLENLRALSDVGFDVFAHGHNLSGGNPAPMSSGLAPAAFELILSQQRRALAGAGCNPDGLRWHQWLQNSSLYAGSDMASILRRNGIDAARGNTSDAEWGVAPQDETLTYGIRDEQYESWLPVRGRYNRRPMAAYTNVPQGGGYDHAGVNPALPTLMRRIEFAATAGQPVQPYNHEILEAPGPYGVSTAFGRDWIAHMDELERAGKIVVTNPTTLEYLTFWRPGETFMRWDGEWVYRHDPTRIAF